MATPGNPTPPPPAPQPPPIDHYVIGFNWVIDRGTTQILLTSVQQAIHLGGKKVTLALSSPGGSPEQAFYAYEILRGLSSQIEVTTHNVGMVQSAAVTIFLAGTKRFATQGATFMTHGTTHNTGGPVTLDHVSYGVESIKADDARAMAIIVERTGKEADTVKEWFAGQKLRDAAFAQEHGIISGIAPLAFTPTTKFHQLVLPT